MQDRTPQIAAAGHRGTTYTGNYASLLLWTIRKAGKRGVTVDGLLGSLGLLSRTDEAYPAFREALDHLWDIGLITCPELEAMPEDARFLQMNQIWRIKP